MSDLSGSPLEEAGAPLVTVAMPIYNAGAYLRMAVLSIVQQTESNWELLIIDDGSTDNALDSIRDIDDQRIRIIRDGANKGLAARLNEAIDLARGKYFARMDQDDVSYPVRFARQLKALQDDLALDLTATRAIQIDEGNRAVGVFPSALSHEAICVHPWKGFYFPHPTWMGKTEWFRKYHYKIPGPYFCEDQELLLRSYSESRFATVNEILFAYRTRSEINWRKVLRTRKAVWRVQLRQFRMARQWNNIILASMVVAGRIAYDLVKISIPASCRPKQVRLEENLTRQWEDVLRIVSPHHSGLTNLAGQAERHGVAE
jgi:glycosyltransferase involved in cell wall biosynthesis